METIKYVQEGHRYLRSSDGMALMSVSHFKELFTPVNWDHNAQKEAAQRYLKGRYKEHKLRWEGEGRHILDPEFITYLLQFMHKETFLKLTQEVRDEWKKSGEDSSSEGSKSHAREEEKAISDGLSMNHYNGKEYPTITHGKQEDGGNSTISECLCDLSPGFYPELLLWYFFPEPVFSQSMDTWICGLAGQSDRVFLDEASSMVDDYKFTTKPLSDFAISYQNFGVEYHSGPWCDIPKTRLSPYIIQLNTYGWMLEQHGLPPEDLRIQNHGKHIQIGYAPERVSEGVNIVFTEGL